MKTEIRVRVTAFIFILISVVLGQIFAINDFTSSIIWPAIGVSFAYFIYYKKTVYLPLLLGAFIGYLFNYIFIIDGFVWRDVLIALLLSNTGIFLSYVAALVTSKQIDSVTLAFKSIIKYLLIITSLSLLTSLFGNIFLLLMRFISFSDVPLSLLVWWLGDFFGLLIFGTSIIFSLFYDQPFKFKAINAEEPLFYALFIGFNVLFFLDLIPFVHYDTHRYLFIPFAIVIAFKFPYRTYYTFSLIFLSFMAFLSPNHDVNYFNHMFDINIFLIAILAIMLSLKLGFKRVKDNNEQLSIKKSRLEHLVHSIEEMMTLAPRLDEANDMIYEKEAKRMFRTIFNLFEKADYASCMAVKDGVKYLDAIGYDLEFLNSLDFNIEDWIVNVDKPRLIKGAEVRLEENLQENYELFIKTNPKVKESVFLSVQLGYDYTVEMAFDLMENSDDSFTESDMEYFESMQVFMNQFYESYLLNIESGKKKNDILNSLINTIGLYDYLIHEHSKDVAYIAKEIAKHMKIGEVRVTNLYWAGIVHDLGKINIDKQILNKPSSLTEQEYEAIKKHPIEGFKILNESHLLQDIALLVRHHHERYDGKGYPDGLKGNQVSLDAYILAMSEAIASMMHTQPYSKKMPDAMIVHTLINEKGRQFHPEVVDVAVELIEAGLIKK